MSKKIKDINFYKKQVAYIKKLKQEQYIKLQNETLRFGEIVNKIFDMQYSNVEANCLKKENEYLKNVIDNLTRKRIQYVIPKNIDNIVYDK